MNTDPFLESSQFINWSDAKVRALAESLASEDPLVTARRCFEWVRDEVKHSWDFQLNPVTCSASDVLRERTGYCFAKSHLLAALLRGNGLRAGMCYQRLTLDGPGTGFSLHGLNAVELPGYGWYRIDPRGNKPGVSAGFSPPVERLAFRIEHDGEADLPGVHAVPLPAIVAALTRFTTWEHVAANLPDIDPESYSPPQPAIFATG